jgi:hypothetical protein
MSAPKSKGFSQIPHGFQKRLAELTGNQLKVWLSHRCMEGKEGESFPSLDKLVEYTGLNLHTVTDARKWLRANGWLTSSGQKHTSQGKFSVPIEHTAIPEAAGGKTTNGGEETANGTGGQTASRKTTNGASGKTTNSAGGFTASGETTTEVDPKSFEVDPNKVNPSNQPTAGSDGGVAGGKNRSETKATAADKKEPILTKELMLDLLREAHSDACENADSKKIPHDLPTMGSDELFTKLHELGITRVDQMEDVTCAYTGWFELRYEVSFVLADEARTASEERGDYSDKKPFIPPVIHCPLTMFSREIKRYLDEAIETHDDRARLRREQDEWYPWLRAFREAAWKKIDLDAYLEKRPVSAEFANRAADELAHVRARKEDPEWLEWVNKLNAAGKQTCAEKRTRTWLDTWYRENPINPKSKFVCDAGRAFQWVRNQLWPSTESQVKS